MMKDVRAFFKTVCILKKMKRTGWVECGVHEPESVAGHSFSVALLALVLSKELKVKDELKFLKMALIHDLAEAKAGDITPKKMSRTKKHELERKALEEVVSTLPLYLRKEIFCLWGEYERGITREARLARQLDKLEMFLQAKEYGEEQNLYLDEFLDCGKNALKEHALKKLANFSEEEGNCQGD